MTSRAMLPTRLAAAALLAAVALGSGACRPKCCTRFTPQPEGTPANEVYQEFPSSGTAETAWRVRWAEGSGKGLYITGAWFRRAPGQPWIRVLWDARLSEIFVPYHTGFPRYYDLGGFGFGLEDAVPGDAGCCGRLIGNPPRVVWEVRDRGLSWKDHAQVRRGQTLVLWGTINAANYNYVVHYGFRDDGMIEFRIGATAQNLPGRRTEAHMHLGLWRVDVDLGGAADNSAMLMRHIEPTSGPTASDVAAAFNRGVEGSAGWNPLEFTGLMIENTAQQNGRGHNIAYELMPMRGGSARHQEAFTQADFWVTRYRGTELAYPQIAGYANGESVTNTDIVVWHATPLHHLPRDEDGRTVDGIWQGVALVMWGGFDLRPRNLFDETPLHP